MRKKTKSQPTTSASVNIDISSYKPLTHCQRTIKNIRRKVIGDFKECFDDFNDDEKKEVEQEVINYLCINDRWPLEIRSETPDSFYNTLNNKWRISIEKEQEIREEIFAQYFPDVPKIELYEVVERYKGLFFMRRRRLLLLEGKVPKVVKDTHSLAQSSLRLHEVVEANKKVEQELEITQPNEVYDSEGEPVTTQLDPIDVDALNGENVTLDTPTKIEGQEK